jgi:hypothetical protein
MSILLPEIISAASTLLDRIIPNPEAKAAAKLALAQAEGQQALSEMQASLGAIIAEANSLDKWTSRARPTFMYVIYVVILMCMLGAIVGVWWPDQVFQSSKNLSELLGAIPNSLWELFGAGYLGYTGARSFDKWKSGAR